MQTKVVLVILIVQLSVGLNCCSSRQENTVKRDVGPLAFKELIYPNLTDGRRNNRRVPVKVIYPEGKGPYPLIIMSHGGMGTWDSHLYQAQHLASHGYVVMCPEHVFSNNVKTKEHMANAKGFFRKKMAEALQRITTDPQSVLERPKDISYVIDRAIEWNARQHPLKGLIDTTKIAVLGHSYGAYTTLVVCGARPIVDYLQPPVDQRKGLYSDLSDDRVLVGVAMSPQGPGTSRFNKESYKTINKPLLCFSGSLDAQLCFDGSKQPAEKRLEGYKLFPPGKKTMLWLENADHLSFADNPKAWLFPSKSRADVQRITKTMTLLFCDIHLKGNSDATKLFNTAHANSLCGAVVTKVKWYEH